MRPRINPRIPDNKQIDFLIEWDQVTTEAAISYTKLLLKHWESVLKSSTENILNIEKRINNQGVNVEEWRKIKETIEKVRQQTMEDMERKQDRRPPLIQNQIQNQTNLPDSVTTTTYSQDPLPQRIRRFQKRNSIVNLSNYKLTKTETSLLEKGLNFIPTPNREHEARIVQDFLLFERKLRLHHKLHKRRTQKKILQKMTQ